MKALVTGGAGFIGSHLAEKLCRHNAEVTVLDNFSLGSEKNLEWITSGDNVRVVRGDIRDRALLDKLLPGCDWVFHQGALPSVPRSVEQPWESNDQNSNGTLNVLIAARDAKVRRLLFASSSSIYGDVDAEFKSEKLPPNPLSPYALQKYNGEKYAQLFHRFYGLETVALRYFNIFGPRQAHDSPYSGVIAKFCLSMLRGERPVVFGDGLQSRDFTYIDNAVAANLAAAEAPVERVAGKFFNVASGKAVTLLDLISELNKITGQELKPEFKEMRKGDVKHSLAALDEARSAFGYSPQIDWKEGLKKTFAWYQENAPAP